MSELEKQDSRLLEQTVTEEKSQQTKTPPVSPERQKAAIPKRERPLFVGRITLGVMLVAVGILVTLRLLIPQMELLRVAKLAPLILVVLGGEILFAALRHRDQQVKVGFGLSLLCLFLIFGAVGASIVPDLWELYGPAGLNEMQIRETDLREEIYEKLDATTVQNVYVHIQPMGSMETLNRSVDIRLTGDYESSGEFAKAAQPAVRLVAELGVNHAFVRAESNTESWTLALEVPTAFRDMTADDLADRVEHERFYLDKNGRREPVEMSRWESMREQGLLVEADAVEQARRAGFEDGYQKAREEFRNEENQV